MSVDVRIINSRPGKWVALPFGEDGSPEREEYRRQHAAIRAASDEGDRRYNASLKQARPEICWDCPCGERHATPIEPWRTIESYQYRTGERTLDGVMGNEEWQPAAAHVSISGSFATYALVTCPATDEPWRICLSSGTPG